MNFFSHNNTHNNRRGGFTLFEMVVSLAIFTILTTTVLLKHSRFKGDILVNGVANQIALGIREQQVSSMSVRGDLGGFSYGHGVNFSKATTTAFIQFVDRNNNDRYDLGTDTLTKTIHLPRGMLITNICAMAANGSQQANQCSATGNVTEVNISFRRPNPNARVTMVGVVGAVGDALIYIESSNKRYKAIKVNFLGQIQVI